MWLWTGFPMSDGGPRLPPTIKAFSRDRPVACSALTSIVSVTCLSSPGPCASLWPPRGRLLRSPPLRSPGSRTRYSRRSPVPGSLSPLRS